MVLKKFLVQNYPQLEVGNVKKLFFLERCTIVYFSNFIEKCESEEGIVAINSHNLNIVKELDLKNKPKLRLLVKIGNQSYKLSPLGKE